MVSQLSHCSVLRHSGFLSSEALMILSIKVFNFKTQFRFDIEFPFSKDIVGFWVVLLLRALINFKKSLDFFYQRWILLTEALIVFQ